MEIGKISAIIKTPNMPQSIQQNVPVWLAVSGMEIPA